MSRVTRRAVLAAGAGAVSLAALPAAIARAVAIVPDRRSGTIMDVDHVVILMQENRGFDHYFGTLRGVRGFGDRFPIPLTDADGTRPVWAQRDGTRTVAPFHLSTRRDFDLMRMAGTPHSWPDAQAAWDEGRMGHWPQAKTRRAMGHYRREDMPFQFALAEAFTICDAFHPSTQTGTNTNRLFLWSSSNDPSGKLGGPAIGNSHDRLAQDGGFADPYRWTTTVERLQDAGIDWRIYQDMADNFTDNPLVGFDRFRRAHAGQGGRLGAELKDRALTTRALDGLRRDVQAGKLPQVSYIIATAKGSEHPGPSSPAQGAAYTAEVIDALTSDPKVWARTALFVLFDENDGFFDHMPPPAPPSRGADGVLLGGSTVALDGCYHDVPSVGDADLDKPAYRGRPYGLGPRVPMYVVSPWSRGGWVNSQVFDHTSVTRFLEARFGIREPNIVPWRRAVCGDLTSAFDFAARGDPIPPALPDPRPDAARAAVLPRQVKPDGPATPAAPWQEPGIRRSRLLPYRLEVTDRVSRDGIALHFSAAGAGATFHVYDRAAPGSVPRRYTVAAGHRLAGSWPFAAAGGYDLWVLGPNGFHRRFSGHANDPVSLRRLAWTVADDMVTLSIPAAAADQALLASVMQLATPVVSVVPLTPGRRQWPLAEALGWYDLTVSSERWPKFRRRLAGRFDRPGRASTSDPFVDGVG